MRILFYSLLSIMLFLTGVLCGCRTQQGGELVVSGRIELDDSHVGSKIGGRIWQVLRREGDEVKAGDPIILLDDRELKAALAQGQASEQQTKAQLDLLLAGTRKEDIEKAAAAVEAQKAEFELRRKGFRKEEIRQAQAQLTAAQSSLELARKELRRAEELAASETISRQELDTKRAAFQNAEAEANLAAQRLALFRSGSRPEEIATAKAQLAQSQAELTRLKNGPRPEEIESARAAYAEARANVTKIQTQLSEMRIEAPLAATIDTLDLRPGDLVKAGDAVAVLNLKTTPYVRCYVPENRLGWVKAGKAVAITVDSFPRRRFAGKIRRVSSEAEFTPRNVQTTEKRSELVFEMKVDVVEGGDMLRPGMYADVHIPAQDGRQP